MTQNPEAIKDKLNHVKKNLVHRKWKERMSNWSKYLQVISLKGIISLLSDLKIKRKNTNISLENCAKYTDILPKIKIEVAFKHMTRYCTLFIISANWKKHWHTTSPNETGNN